MASYQVAGFTPNGSMAYSGIGADGSTGALPAVEPNAIFTPPAPPKKTGLLGLRAYIQSGYPLPTVSAFAPGSNYLQPGASATLVVTPSQRPAMVNGKIAVSGRCSKKKVRCGCGCTRGTRRARRGLSSLRSLRQDEDFEDAIPIPTSSDITDQIPYESVTIPGAVQLGPTTFENFSPPSAYGPPAVGQTTVAPAGPATPSSSNFAQPSAIASIGSSIASTVGKIFAPSAGTGQQQTPSLFGAPSAAMPLGSVAGLPTSYLIYGLLGLAGIGLIFSLVKR